MSKIKRIDIKEFRASGYLQEVNRLFFHPLGLALEVIVQEDGSESLGGVWDFRDDPEGIAFGDDCTLSVEHAARIEAERAEKSKVRKASLGFDIQPVLCET